MADDVFLLLDDDERRKILAGTAQQLGRTAKALEKDVWVCWALEHLWATPNAVKMAFKGGTSLSKVYAAIERFSEDVDVTLDYRDLDPAFDNGYANYDACASGALRLVPGDEATSALRTDYQQMVEAAMFFGTAPSFDEVVARVRKLEAEINAAAPP